MVVWTGYTVSALMSYIALEGDFYYYKEETVLRTVTWEPLLFVLIFYLIVSIPIWKVDERNIDFSKINFNNSLFKSFVQFNLIFFVVVSALKIYELTVISSMSSFGELYEFYHDDSIQNRNLVAIIYQNRLLQMISGVGGYYCPTMSPLLVVYYISRIARTHKLDSETILGIIIALIPVLISGVIGASRGSIFFSMFLLLFYYMIIRHYINKSTKRIIVGVAVLVVALFVSISYAITDSRVEERGSSYTAGTDIMMYFGQPMINAGFYYDKIYYHPKGLRWLDRLYGIRSDNPVISYQDYWNNKTGSEVQLFKTLFGDLYLEFGLIGAFVVVMLTTLMWKKIVIQNYRKPIYMPFLWFYFNILIFGIFNYKIDTFKGLWFPVFVIFCIMLSSKLKKNKSYNL